MKNKYTIVILFSIFSILLQFFFAPVLVVNSIKPDFFVIAVIYGSLVLMPIPAMIIAFLGGIILDSYSNMPLGTSAIVYVWGSFVMGYFKKFEYWLGFNFTVIAVMNILIVRSFLIGIYIFDTEMSFVSFFISRVIPETIYTFAFAGILFVFIRDYVQELAE